jgi:transposase-like protein
MNPKFLYLMWVFFTLSTERIHVMAFKKIEPQKKFTIVKEYWAANNITAISKKSGISRTSLYSWIAQAENAVLKTFQQIRPGPRLPRLQEENNIQPEKSVGTFNNYHNKSQIDSLTQTEEMPAQACPACGQRHWRKNGTVATKKRGLSQRYSCRQCTFSFFIAIKKKDLSTEIQFSVNWMSQAEEIENPAIGERQPMTEDTPEVVTVTTNGLGSTMDLLSPSGFLCLLAKFAEKIGFFKLLENQIQLPNKQVRYTPLDKMKTIIAAIALGCPHIQDINYLLRPYPVMAQSLSMVHFPEQSTINRLLHQFSSFSLLQLENGLEQLLLQFGIFRQQPKVDFDFDNTGLMVYGHTFEFARKGYFPKHPGAKGYQLSMAYSFGNVPSEILFLHLAPGNYSPAAYFWDAIYQVMEILGSVERIGIIRADAAQGTGENIQELIDMGLDFIIKGFHPHTACNFAKNVSEKQWIAIDFFSHVVDLGLRKITNCCHLVRVILIRTYNTRQGQIEFSHLYVRLTQRQMSAPEIFDFYNHRQNIEALFNCEKHGMHLTPMKTRKFDSILAFLYFNVMTFNLLNWFKFAMLKNTPFENIGINDFINKLMRIPAYVTTRARQMELRFPAEHPMIKKLAAAQAKIQAHG